MFDVVMFLIENYTNNGVNFISDKESIMAELERIGFHPMEIDRALDWLDGLEDVQKITPMDTCSGQAFRYYMGQEVEHITVEGIGFLQYLEQIKILDPVTREIAIDRLMVLDEREIDIARIKWVVLVALYSQPQKKAALSIFQDLILSDAFGQSH